MMTTVALLFAALSPVLFSFFRNISACCKILWCMSLRLVFYTLFAISSLLDWVVWAGLQIAAAEGQENAFSIRSIVVTTDNACFCFWPIF